MNIFEGKIWISLALLMLLSSKSVACSCGDPNIPVMHENASIVFVGDLAKKRSFYSFTKNKYVFSNLTIYKGEELESVTLWSNKASSACGIDFKKGLRYVVFAYKDGNKLIADRCSSWHEADEYKKDYTDAFYRFYSK